MPGTLQALAVLLILLPGFLAAYILQSLVSRPKQSDLEKLIEALILSLIIYLASALMAGKTLPISWQSVPVQRGYITYEIQLDWWKLLVLLLLPIVLGLLFAFLMQHDYVLRLFREASLTDRTSRASTWNDVLRDIQGMALVQLADGAASWAGSATIPTIRTMLRFFWSAQPG